MFLVVFPSCSFLPKYHPKSYALIVEAKTLEEAKAKRSVSGDIVIWEHTKEVVTEDLSWFNAGEVFCERMVRKELDNKKD